MKPKDRARTSRRFNRRSFLLAASAGTQLVAQAEDSPPELYGEYPKEGLFPDDQGLGLVVHTSRMNGCITYLAGPGEHEAFVASREGSQAT